MTVPAEMAPVPVLAAAASVRIGAAAATRLGSVIATPMLPAALRVGLMRNRSPVAAVPLTTIDKPSAVNGSSYRAGPASVTAAPVSSRVRAQPVAVFCRW